MADRKKNGDDNGYAVLAEDLKSKFAVFGEAVQGARDDVKSLREHVDERFTRVDRDVGLVKAAVTEHSKELREIRATVTRIEGALTTKVDRDELDARLRALPGR